MTRSSSDIDVGETSERPPAANSGRPQDEDLTAHILEATAALLQEAGFDRLTIADVAERAQCGRGAIYRRWPAKEQLALAALRGKDWPNVPLEDDPRTNIGRIARNISNEVDNSTQLIAGFLAASRDDAELASVMRERVAAPDRELLRQQITQVVGDNAAVVDFLADAIPGVALLRSLIFDEPVATDQIAVSIDEILSLTAKRQSSPSSKQTSPRLRRLT